jgi:hypothetical protein
MNKEELKLLAKEYINKAKLITDEHLSVCCMLDYQYILGNNMIELIGFTNKDKCIMYGTTELVEYTLDEYLDSELFSIDKCSVIGRLDLDDDW